MDLIVSVIVAAIVAALVGLRGRRRDPGSSAGSSAGSPAGSPATDEAPGSLATELGTILADVQWGFSLPSDLLRDSAFLAARARLHERRPGADALLALANGNDQSLIALALHALAEEPPSARLGQALLAYMGKAGPLVQWFLLDAIRRHVGGDVVCVGWVLATIGHQRPSDWHDDFPGSLGDLRRWIVERVEGGERLDSGLAPFAQALDGLSADRVDGLRRLFEKLDDVAALAPLRARFEKWAAERVDRSALEPIGRVWPARDDRPAPIAHRAFDDAVAEATGVLAAAPPRPVVFVGPPGVGKRTAAEETLSTLRAEGWTVFEARARDVMAGQVYIGQLEERLRALIDQIGVARRILWYAPDLPDFLWAGRHQQNPTGLLDHILPLIERGEIVVVATAGATPFERLTRSMARVGTVFQVVRLAPPPEANLASIAESWTSCHAPDRFGPHAVAAAVELGTQYVTGLSAPGNVIELLRLSVRRVDGDPGRTGTPIDVDDVVMTLVDLTGLPRRMLDDRMELDLDELRGFFESRVMGQGEAVDALVERVAMVKAGLTDPTRPLGVFFFVGPTGTGKTEIAKALAEYLFGSADRMIRVDMSELQTPDSLDRLVGESSHDGLDTTESLVTRARREPFSVVLLDEFEKAHHLVWDLFLQVFDDGRLTSRRGITADFRHAIIIMTSNLGALASRGATPGFTAADRGFHAGDVTRAMESAFRPEFLNRIDRTVVFRPLSRRTMEDVLKREIDAVFARRGLRHRQWAVEWDDAALSFLLERGFSERLGARPLKRAIDRYLLAPLASVIIRRQYPGGDQFLYVGRGRDALTVTFIDPDRPAPVDAIETVGAGDGERATLSRIMLNPTGSRTELAFLTERLESLRDALSGSTWTDTKQALMTSTYDPAFWSREDRFSVLGRIEYMDRIESGLRTAESLAERLVGGARKRDRWPAEMLQRLGERLYLIGVAIDDVWNGRPDAAYLSVSTFVGRGSDPMTTLRFATRLADMYRRWSERRGMTLTELTPGNRGRADGPSASETVAVFAIGGFGAHSLLEPEHGLHVLDEPGDPDDDRRTRSGPRHQARVRVAAQPDEPVLEARDGRSASLSVARERLGVARPEDHRIVRRYREEPAPLARDAIRGWRTGRLDLVWGGAFDILGGDGTPETSPEGGSGTVDRTGSKPTP